MSKNDFGYPDPSLARIKINQRYNMVRPKPGTSGTWHWLNSLSIEQIKLLDKWNHSDDMAEQTVMLLAIVGLEGGEVQENELEKLMKRAEEHIAFRIEEAPND